MCRAVRHRLGGASPLAAGAGEEGGLPTRVPVPPPLFPRLPGHQGGGGGGV